MKTLLGLVAPLEGELSFDTSKEIHIGYLPQITQVQKDFPASVEEIVLSGCLKKTGKSPFYKKTHKVQAHVNMKKLNICDLAKKSYRNLSGGQQQRVLLARALCAAEDILLMDEPTAGLDSASTAEMYEYIEKLNKEGMTIIMISHDMEAVEYATHVLDFNENISFMTRVEYEARKAVR
jgi:zinc transport system ATP-binding protein